LQVFIRDNNVDQALRVLKKKMQREGVFREMKLRRLRSHRSRLQGRRLKRCVADTSLLASKRSETA
jgi:small subunit ribosomal protein S21